MPVAVNVEEADESLLSSAFADTSAASLITTSESALLAAAASAPAGFAELALSLAGGLASAAGEDAAVSASVALPAVSTTGGRAGCSSLVHSIATISASMINERPSRAVRCLRCWLLLLLLTCEFELVFELEDEEAAADRFESLGLLGLLAVPASSENDEFSAVADTAEADEDAAEAADARGEFGFSASASTGYTSFQLRSRQHDSMMRNSAAKQQRADRCV